MANKIDLLELNDQELLVKIKENPDYLGIVYKRCKSNCLGFMRKMTSGKISDYELEDIYQDASIILYEKIVKGDFVLTASLQVYLNSVCRFQLLNYIKKNRLTIDYQENHDDDDDNENYRFNQKITDILEPIEDVKEDQYKAIEIALEIMKAGGGHCYELLTLFWYHKKSMNELTTEFGYTNEANTRSQKAKCQKRLEKIAFNELNN